MLTESTLSPPSASKQQQRASLLKWFSSSSVRSSDIYSGWLRSGVTFEWKRKRIRRHEAHQTKFIFSKCAFLAFSRIGHLYFSFNGAITLFTMLLLRHLKRIKWIKISFHFYKNWMRPWWSKNRRLEKNISKQVFVLLEMYLKVDGF